MPIGKLDIGLFLNTANVTKGLKKTKKEIGAFGVAVGTAFGNVASQGILAFGRALEETLTHGFDVMEQFNDASNRIGKGMGGAVEMKALSRGLMDLGVDAEAAEGLVLTLSKTIGDALGGKANKSVKALKALGIAVTDTTGAALPMSEVVAQIVSKVQELGFSAEAVALANTALGGSAKENEALLRGQASAITDVTRAHLEGAQQWQTTQQKLEAFSDAVELLKVKLIEALLPAIDDFMDALPQIGDAIGKLFEWFQRLVPKVDDAGSALDNVPSNSIISFWNACIAGIGAVIGAIVRLIVTVGNAIGAIVKLGQALQALFAGSALGVQAMVTMANPIEQVANMFPGGSAKIKQAGVDLETAGNMINDSFALASEAGNEFVTAYDRAGVVADGVAQSFIASGTIIDSQTGAVTDLSTSTEDLTTHTGELVDINDMLNDSLGGGGGGGGGTSAVEQRAQEIQAYAEDIKDATEPLRVYTREMQKYNEAVAAGALGEQHRAAAVQFATEAQTAATDRLKGANTAMQDFKDGLESWGNSVASSLADAIVEGENLEDVFQSLIKALIKMAIEMLVLKPLMASIGTGLGSLGIPGLSAAAAAPASFAAPAPARNTMRALPRMGASSGGRNASAGRSSSVSLGDMTINLGAGGEGGLGVDSNSARGKAFGTKIRGLIQNEMVKQARPGGLLWAGPGR